MATTVKDPQAELAKILAMAEKKFGKGVLHKASEAVPVNRLPFLQPNLNRATEGGPAFGRFMGMSGDPNSGKSLVALQLIAQAQQLPRSAEVVLIPRIAYHSALADETFLADNIRANHATMAQRLSDQLDWFRETFPNGADAVYYNVEGQFDPTWARRTGIDLDRLVIFQSTTIEEIVEVMQNLYQHVPLHVVDSTSSASSLLSQKQEVGKSLIGVDARQWKVCLRDSMPSFDIQRNMAILVHQLSTNIKTGGQVEQSTRYMRFISRLTLMFRHAKFLYEKDGVLVEDKSEGLDKGSLAGIAEADGRQIVAKVEKSTTCRPFRIADMQWHYKRSNFVGLHDLAASGIYYGIIRKSGSWYRVADEEANVGQGLKAVYARLADDADLRDRISNIMLDFTDEM